MCTVAFRALINEFVTGEVYFTVQFLLYLVEGGELLCIFALRGKNSIHRSLYVNTA